LLYTECLCGGHVRGDVRQLLDHDAGEHPVGAAAGGCIPSELAKAARIGTAAGYAEINLNVGCPSDRVKNGSFAPVSCSSPRWWLTACALARAHHLPVTVKCRIGIDEARRL